MNDLYSNYHVTPKQRCLVELKSGELVWASIQEDKFFYSELETATTNVPIEVDNISSFEMLPDLEAFTVRIVTDLRIADTMLEYMMLKAVKRL